MSAANWRHTRYYGLSAYVIKPCLIKRFRNIENQGLDVYLAIKRYMSRLNLLYTMRALRHGCLMDKWFKNECGKDTHFFEKR